MIKSRVFLTARSWTIRSCGLLLNYFCVRWRRTVQFLQAIHNEVSFNTVLGDIWFGNVKNMELISSKGKQFIMPLKVNRKVSLHYPSNPENREYVSVESLKLQEDKPVKVWLKGYSKPLLLAKQVFKNKDKSTGILYLVASDVTASYSCMTITTKEGGLWRLITGH